MSAEENERLWRALRDIQLTQQNQGADLRELRVQLLQSRVSASEGLTRLALKTGTVSALGAGAVMPAVLGAVDLVWPLVRSALHGLGWM